MFLIGKIKYVARLEKFLRHNSEWSMKILTAIIGRFKYHPGPPEIVLRTEHRHGIKIEYLEGDSWYITTSSDGFSFNSKRRFAALMSLLDRMKPGEEFSGDIHYELMKEELVRARAFGFKEDIAFWEESIRQYESGEEGSDEE